MREEVKPASFEYIEVFYNRMRLHSIRLDVTPEYNGAFCLGNVLNPCETYKLVINHIINLLIHFSLRILNTKLKVPKKLHKLAIFRHIIFISPLL